MATAPLDILTRMINETGPGVRGIQGNLKKLDAMTGQLNKGFSRLQGIMGKGLKVAGIAGAAGVAGLGAAFGFAFKTANEMNASLETSTLQFETLMGDAQKAKDHVAFLFEFAKETPFETEPIIAASRNLQTFGGEALNSTRMLRLVGDASAAVSQPLDDLAFWVGRAYSAIQGGQPFGEAAMRLQEMAILTPQARREMEELQKAGADASEVWGVFEGELGNFTGAMGLQAATWSGLMATIEDAVNITLSTALKPFFDLAKRGLEQVAAIVDSEELEAGVQRLAGRIENVINVFTRFFDRAEKGLPTIMNVRALVVQLAKALGMGQDRAAALGDRVSGLLEMLDALRKYVRFTIEEGDSFNDFLMDVPENIRPIVRLGGSLLEFLTETVPKFVEWKDVLGAVGLFIGAVIVKALVAFMAAAAPAVAVILLLIGTARALRTAWETDFLEIQGIAEQAMGGIGTIIEGLSFLFAGNTEVAGQKLREGFGIVFESLKQLLSNLWTEVLEPPLRTLWDNAVNWFQSQDWAAHGQAIIDGILTGLSGLGTSILETISGTDWTQVGSQITEGISGGLETIGLDGLFGGTENLEGTIGPALDGLFSRIQGFIDGVKVLWDQHGNTIIAVVLTAWTVLQSVVDGVIASLGPTIESFITNGTTALESFGPTIEMLKGLWQSLQPIIGTVMAVIGALVLAGVAAIMGALRGISNAIAPLATAFNGILQIVIGVINILVLNVTNGVRALVALFQGDTTRMAQIWQEHMAQVSAIWENIKTGIVNLVSGLVGTVMGFISGLVQGMIDFFTEMYMSLVGGSIVPDMVNGILDWFGTLVSDGIAFVSDLWSSIKEKFSTAKTELMNKAREIITGIIERFRDKIGEFASIGVNLITSLADSLWNRATTYLKEKAQGVASLLPDWVKALLGITSPSKVFWAIGADSVAGLEMGLTDNARSLYSSARDLGQMAKDGLLQSLSETGELERASRRMVESIRPRSVPEIPVTFTPMLASGLSGGFSGQVQTRRPFDPIEEFLRRGGGDDRPVAILQIDARGAETGVEDRIRDVIEDVLQEKGYKIEARLRRT